MDNDVCAYCMQKFEAVQDPRRLPCGHAFCLNCLKAEKFSRGVTSHRCTFCRATHEDVDLDSLPSALSDDEESVESESDKPSGLHEFFCDRCENQPAVKYCIDCGEKICSSHMKFHDGFYEDLHEAIDIKIYAQDPGSFVKVFACKRHKGELISMVCEDCYQYNCFKCDSGEKTCCGVAYPTMMSPPSPLITSPKVPVSKEQSPMSFSWRPTPPARKHSFCPLMEVRSKIERSFDKLLDRTYDQLQQVDAMEKVANDKIEKLVDKCKNMLAVVEAKSEEQIQLIKLQASQLQQTIKSFEEEKKQQVYGFVSGLLKKKEEIIAARRRAYTLLHNSHTAQLVEQGQDMKESLERVSTLDFGRCEWADKYLSIGKKRQLEVQLYTHVPGKVVPSFDFQGYNWQD